MVYMLSLNGLQLTSVPYVSIFTPYLVHAAHIPCSGRVSMSENWARGG